MTLAKLQISYPDFQMGTMIDPEQFDTNNGEIVTKINEVVDAVNNAGISYVHPATHPASMIAEDATRRFTTDAEKAKWNAYQNTLNSIASAMYPVGSIYMSTTSANPNTFFGGTWVAWGSGKVPVGVDTAQSEFNTVEKVGGEKAHTLTVNEMPQHAHTLQAGQTFAGSGSTSITFLDGGVQPNYDGEGTVGGSAPHNNLQPYITCYMWKRTA